MPNIVPMRLLQAFLRRRARILCYHSVSDARNDRFSLTPAQFESHLRLLRREGWEILSLAKLVDRLPSGAGYAHCVVLTFDDGYLDFLEYALPLLQAYDVPATLYVPAELLGETSAWYSPAPNAPLLSHAQLERVAAQGVEIGSHGLAHRRLPSLDPAALEQEVAGSRRQLEDLLGVAPASFSYPFGEWSADTISAVRRAGYRSAVDYGGLLGNGSDTDLLRLKRDPITRPTSPSADASLRSILNARRDLSRILLRLLRPAP